MRIRKVLVAIGLVHLLPAAAWASFKPVRVLAPELLGLHCTQQGICVDDVSRLTEAAALKAEAVTFVSARVGELENIPRMIFCSGAACAKAFGFTHQGAYNVGTFGLVVGPRGWLPYFVRHELIHHLQNERLGSLNAWFFKPTWFLEGMAYSLSDDPRRPLPGPLQDWRSSFETWYSEVGHHKLWQAASAL
jgi:hypothetical protein